MDQVISTLKFISSNNTDTSSQQNFLASAVPATNDVVFALIAVSFLIFMIFTASIVIARRHKIKVLASQNSNMQSSSKNFLLIFIVFLLSLACIIYPCSTQIKAFADSKNSSLSATDIIATINSQTEEISFIPGSISNNSSQDYFIKQISLVKETAVDDDGCSWEIYCDNTIIYNGLSSSTPQNQDALNPVSVKSNNFISVNLNQIGMNFETAQELIGKDVLKIIFNVEKKADDTYKLQAKEEINNQANLANNTLYSLDYISDTEKNNYIFQVQTQRNTAYSNIDMSNTYSEVDSAKENGIASIQNIENDAIKHNLENAKNQVKSEGTEIFNSSNSEIDNCHNLPLKARETDNNSYKNQIKHEYTLFIKNVDAADSVEEVITAKESYAPNIENIVEQAQTQNQASYWTVIYNVNGHGQQIEPVKNKYQWDNAIDIPTEPTEQNFIFLGWYKEQSCVTKWDFDSDKIGENPACNTDSCTATLYAKWSQKQIPAISDLTFNPPSKLEYDATAKSASFSCKSQGMGEITVKYSKSLNTPANEWVTDAPINAGTYYVMASIDEGNTYASADLSAEEWKFTITAIKVTVPQAEKNLVYNTREQIGVEFPDGETRYKLSNNSGTDAKTYCAFAALKDKVNYVWDDASLSSEDRTINWEIAKYNVNVKADDKATYVGSKLLELTSVNDPLLGGDTYSGKIETNADQDIVGNYEISQGSLTAGDNYNINFTKGTYAVIDKLNQTLYFNQASIVKEYNSGSFTQEVEGATTPVIYSSSNTNVANVAGTSGEVTIHSAGTVTITATAQESAEYKIGQASYTLTVSPIKIAVPQAETNLTYNANEQFGVKLPDGETRYSISENKKTNAGNYIAKAQLVDKTNYVWDIDTPTSDDQNIEWRINPKSLIGVSISGINASYDYTGEIIHPQPSNVTTNNGLNVPQNNYTLKYPADGDYINPGSYTVEICAKNNSNFKDSASQPFVIVKPEQQLKIDKIDDQTYNAYEITPSIVVRDINGNILSEDQYSKIYANNIDAGPNAQVLVTGTTAPYIGYTCTQNFTINKKDLTVNGAAVSNKEYDGTTNANVTNQGTLDGVASPDKIEIESVSASFKDANAGQNKPVNVKYAISGDKVENYELHNPTGIVASIEPVKVAVPQAKTNLVYDATEQIGVILPEKETKYVLSSYSGIDAKTYNTLATLNDKTNYVWNDATLSSEDITINWTIDKRQISVIAEDKSSYVGSELVELTSINDTLLGKDTYVGQLETKADKNTVGNYDILQGSLSAGDNYCINFTKACYEVKDKQDQTLYFDQASISKDYDIKTFTQQVNGAKTPVTYSSSDTRIASVDKISGEVNIHSVGTIAITATAQESAEYKSSQASYLLTINPVKVSLPHAQTHLIYNGSEQTGVKVPEGETRYKLSDNVKTDADNYIAKAELNDKSNYVWDTDTPTSVDQSIEWSISPKSLAGANISGINASYEYTGKVINPIPTKVTTDDGINVPQESYTLYYPSDGDYINPGNYDVEVRANTNSNFKDSAIQNFFITKLEQKLAIDQIDSQTYNAHEITPNIIVRDTAGKILGDDQYSKIFVNNIDAGSNAQVLVTGTVEPYIGYYGLQNFTIDKKTLNVIGATVSDKEYDGTTIATVSNQGTLDGVVSSDKIQIESVSASFKDAKAEQNKPVELEYSISGDKAYNYQIINPADVAASINPAKVAVPQAEKNLIYNASEQTGVKLPDGETKYNLSDNIKTNADQYTATAHLNDQNNFVWDISDATSDDQYIDWAIDKFLVNVKADDKNSYVGSELVELTSVNDPLLGKDTYSGKLQTTANKDVIGIYEILIGSLSAGDNYSINFTKAHYNVKDKQEQTLSFDQASITKDYGTQSFTQEVNGAKTPVIYSSSDTSTASVDKVSGKVTVHNAGTTTITASAQETAECKSSQASYQLTVNPIKIPLPKAKVGLTYNAKEQTGVELPNGEVRYTLTDNINTNAGSYIAKAELTDKTNYVWDIDIPTSNNQDIEWSIKPKSLIGANITGIHESYEYTGYVTKPEPSKVTTDDGINVPQDSYTLSYPTDGDYIEPGSYTVKVCAKDNSNFKDSATQGFLIIKLEQKLTIDKIDDQTYNACEITPKIFVKDENGNTLNDDQYSKIYVNNIDAGSNAQVMVTGTVEPYIGNYGFQNFTINKKNLTVNGTSISDKEYDGTTIATVSNQGKLDGVVSPDKIQIASVSASFKDANAGQSKPVDLEYSISGDKAYNYQIINPVDVVASINPAKVAVPQAEKNLIYNASEQTGVKLPDGETKYKLSDNIKINADQYTATAHLYDQNNFVWDISDPKSEDQHIDWAIDKFSVNVKADNKSSYVGSNLVELTSVNDPLLGKDTYSGKLKTNANKDVIGNYEILQGSLSAGNNYSINFTKANYNVKDKQNQTLNFDQTSITKDYGTQSFTQEVKGAKTPVIYSSSNTSIASVDEISGKVTIHTAGSVNITATARESAEYKSSQASYLLTINPIKVKLPTAKIGLVYNAKEQTGVELPDGETRYNIFDNIKTNAGSYITKVELTDKTNYVWDIDAPTSDDQNIEWTISAKSLIGADISGIKASYDYTGKVIQPEPSKVTTDDGIVVPPDSYTLSYPTVGDYIEPGSYTVGVCAKDKSNFQDSVTQEFLIVKLEQKLIIEQIKEQTYNASEISPAITVKDPSGHVLTDKEYSKIYVNNIDATPNAQVLVTGTVEPYIGCYGIQNFTINKKNLTVKGASVSDKEYDSTTSATVTNQGTLNGVVSPDEIQIASVSASFKDAEAAQDKPVNLEYTISGTKSHNYQLINPTDVVASINPVKVAVPQAEKDLIYNTYKQTGVKIPEGETRYDISNNIQTNAGNYEALVHLNDQNNYVWNTENPTSEDQIVKWCINKADQNIILDSSSGSIKLGSSLNVGFQFSGNADAEFTVNSDDEKVANATVDKTTRQMTITGMSAGKTSICIKAAESENYDESNKAFYNITVAPKDEFYAVFNTASEGDKSANTLSFYYDDNKENHSQRTKTIYENLPTNATWDSDWGYNNIRDKISNVVIDSSVQNYHELKSTVSMFTSIKMANDISGCQYLDVSNVTNMTAMFYAYGSSNSSIVSVPDVTNWDTSNVTDMHFMFSSYAASSFNITDVPNVANWDTSNVTSMFYMFNCYAYSSNQTLQDLDLSTWSITSLTKSSYMFTSYAHDNSSNNRPKVMGSNWSTKKDDVYAAYMFYDSKLKGNTDGNWESANLSESGCFSIKNHVESITLDNTTLNIVKNEVKQLTATILPENASEKSIIWSSSNNEIATVDDYGNVTGKNQGIATITATTVDGGKTATCKVDVTNTNAYNCLVRNIDNQDVVFLPAYSGNAAPCNFYYRSENAYTKLENITNMASLAGAIGTKENAKNIYTDCTQEDIFYGTLEKSWNDTFIKDDSSEYAKCLNENLSNTLAHSRTSTVYNFKAYTRTAWDAVNATPGTPQPTPKLNGINFGTSLDNTSEFYGAYKNLLSANASSPLSSRSSGDYSAYRWNVSKSAWDTESASTDPAIILSMKYIPEVPVTSITLDNEIAYLATGDTAVLNATVYPDNATIKKVTWSSNNDRIASVDNKGTITANSTGYVTITATTEDGGYSASCSFTIKNPWDYKPIVKNIDNQEVVFLPAFLKDVLLCNFYYKSEGTYTKIEDITNMASLANAIGTKENAKNIYTDAEDATFYGVMDRYWVETFAYDESSQYATGLNNDFKNMLSKEGVSTVYNFTDETRTAWDAVDAELESKKPVPKLNGINYGTSLYNKNEFYGAYKNLLSDYAHEPWSSHLYQSVYSYVWSNNDSCWCAYLKSIMRGVVLSLNFNPSVPVTGITLDKNNVTVGLDSSTTLHATVQPGDATCKSVKWTSSNEDIVCVDDNGTITGKNIGGAIITATTVDGYHSASCSVTVLDNRYFKPIVRQLFDQDVIFLPAYSGNTPPGNFYKLEGEIITKIDNITNMASLANAIGTKENAKNIYTDATNVKLYGTFDQNWSDTFTGGDNGGYATGLNNNFSSEILDAGISTVYNFTDETRTEWDVWSAYPGAHYPVPKLDGIIYGDNVQDSTQFYGAYKNLLSNNALYPWGSKASGKIDAYYRQANNGGLWQVTSKELSTSQSVVLSIEFPYVHATDIKLDKDTVDACPGDIDKLTATIMPDNASNKSVQWASSNTDVVTVDAEGNLSLKDVGNAIVTATTIDGELSASCSVNVRYPGMYKPIFRKLNSDETIFLPAYSGDTPPCNFYKKINNKYERIKGVTNMASLCEKIELVNNPQIIYTDAQDITFYGTLGRSWNETFNDVLGQTGLGLTDSMKEDLKYDGTDIKYKTVYFENNDDIKPLRIWNWDAHLIVSKELKNPKLEDVNYTTFFNSYKSLLAKSNPYAIEPLSSRINDDNTSQIWYWDTYYNNWNKTSKKDTKHAAVISMYMKYIAPTGITLDKTDLSLKKERSYKLNATVHPDDATDKSVKWSSSDSNIVSVDENGNIRANDFGSATITATTFNGISASCHVTVPKNFTPIAKYIDGQLIVFTPAYSGNTPPCNLYRKVNNAYIKITGITDMTSLASVIGTKENALNIYIDENESENITLYGTMNRTWNDTFYGDDGDGHSVGLNSNFEKILSNVGVSTAYHFTNDTRTTWDGIGVTPDHWAPEPKLNGVVYAFNGRKSEFYTSYKNLLASNSDCMLSSANRGNDRVLVWRYEEGETNFYWMLGWTTDWTDCSIMLAWTIKP